MLQEDIEIDSHNFDNKDYSDPMSDMPKSIALNSADKNELDVVVFSLMKFFAKQKIDLDLLANFH